MEDNTSNIMERLVKRASDFEKSMAAIEIRSLTKLLKFYEDKFESLFDFMNEKEPYLVGNWIAEWEARRVEEE